MLAITRCTPEYWEFVRKLRTDPRTAAGFVQQAMITREQQIAYMAKHWQNYFVALRNGEAVGYVGVVDGDIRICTHPDHQGTGVATFMVSEISTLFPDAWAKIKSENKISRHLFEACGYVPTFVIYELPARSRAERDRIDQ